MTTLLVTPKFVIGLQLTSAHVVIKETGKTFVFDLETFVSPMGLVLGISRKSQSDSYLMLVMPLLSMDDEDYDQHRAITLSLVPHYSLV